jgi:hypothetical protein
MGDIAWLRPAWLCVLMERRLSPPCRLCSFGLSDLFLPRGTEGSNLASSSGESGASRRADREAIGLIDIPSMAAYEEYRKRLADDPEHKANVARLEQSGHR